MGRIFVSSCEEDDEWYWELVVYGGFNGSLSDCGIIVYIVVFFEILIVFFEFIVGG